MTLAESTALKDFEAFLEPDFDAIHHANEVVISTNGTDGTELDLVTPIKKLQFDSNETDKRMSQITTENYDELINNFTKIEACKKLLSENINVSVERINTSYNRLHNNVVQPYDEAIKLNDALRKIHSTLDLLRSSSHFIYLIQQVEELSRQDDDTMMVRLSKLYNQLSDLYDSSKSPLSIKLIKGYYPVLANKKLELQTQNCQHILNTPHLTTEVQPHLLSLYYINKPEFFSTVEKSAVNKQVQNSANQLSRLLQSPRNFTSVMSEVYEFSKEHFENVNIVLSSCESEQQGNLLSIVLAHVHATSLYDVYWQRLSAKFKKSIAATMARGGPIAKNLRIYNEGIKNSINDIFADSTEKNLILDAVSIIVS